MQHTLRLLRAVGRDVDVYAIGSFQLIPSVDIKVAHGWIAQTPVTSIGRNGGIEERTNECPAGKGEDGTAAKGAGADAERGGGGDACVAEVGEAW